MGGVVSPKNVCYFYAFPSLKVYENPMTNKLFFIAVAITACFAITTRAAEPERLLFSFGDAANLKQWQTVNDGVMGGRSVGRMRHGSDGTLNFYGTLSLANNGGFASVRSRGSTLNLNSNDVLVARVRGDGREYSLNLYPKRRRTAFSYRAKFKTKKDEWTEVRIPLSNFVASYFGRTLNQRPDPRSIGGIGFLLGDKQPGPFRLEIDWVKAETGFTPMETLTSK